MSEKGFDLSQHEQNNKKNSNINYEITKGEKINPSEDEEYEEYEEEIEENEKEKEIVSNKEKKVEKEKKESSKSSFSSERSDKKSILNLHENSNNKNEENLIGKTNDIDYNKNTKININNNKDIKEENNTLLLKKIKELESEIKEKNIIIRNISNKNIKLNNSLADFSKRLDKEMTKKKEKINNKTNINETGKVKEKELDNAVNMIKILRNDSSRLQKIIDENKKQLEYENKKYENILALNNNFKTKIEKLEEKIKKLCQENNDLKMNLKKEEEKYNKLLEKNFYKNNSQRNNSDKKIKSNIDNAIKNYKINSKIVPTIKKSNYFKQNDKNLKNSSSLPRLHLKNLKIKNNNEIDNDDLRIIFNKEEITRIKSIFENDNNLLEILINKINILNQSKESSNKKNNYEKKKLNEKIITMQKNIES